MSPITKMTTTTPEPSEAQSRPQSPVALPPFLRCPPEIRLQIYRLLLVREPSTIDPTDALAPHPDYHEYGRREGGGRGGNRRDAEKVAGGRRVPSHHGRVLCMRNEIPTHFNPVAPAHTKRRSSYKIRTDRFRNRCMDVTYQCLNAPIIHTNILAASRQTHEEAAPLLYAAYTFDFDTHIEAVEPFFSDLTPYSRSLVRRVGIVKKALPYERDFDRCEWSSMCAYVASELRLRTLSLGVVSGRPMRGWDAFEEIPEAEFGPLVLRHRREEMDWVRALLEIKGLEGLEVRACVEHCPPPSSDAMLFFVTFSASVAKGFSTFLAKQMVPV